MAYHMRDLDLQRRRYDDLKIGARRKSPQRYKLRENPELLRSQRLGATKSVPRRYMPIQVCKYARKAQNTPKMPKIALIRPRPQMRL